MGDLKVKIKIDAVLRQLSILGVGYYIVQKGDPDTGVILLKLADTRGQAKLISQMRNLDGALEWYDVLGKDMTEEQEADAYIAKARRTDPDLWVIEVEDQAMRNPFDSNNGIV